MIPAGHFHYCFFERSETFIYHQLASLKDYRPVAISLISKNLEEFPLPNGAHYDVGFDLPRPGLQFIYPFRYRALKLTAELFRREKISLLHAHFGTWGAYALPLKKTLRVPLIVTFYGQDMSILPKRTVWKRRYGRLWNEADLFLAEGPHMMKRLTALGAPRDKVALQRIGIPVSEIEFIPPASLPRQGTPRALWAGRMIEKKGLLDAIKAAAILRAQGLALELRIIGDGPQLPKAQKLVEDERLGQSVKFLGFLDYRSYLDEFREADFFIAPSRTSAKGETEGGAPTTILEAQARGLPVVATRHADIPFIVPRDYPYLCGEADPLNLAEIIKKLFDARRFWPRIAREGHEYVKRYHDLKVTIQSLQKHYEDVLSRKERKGLS